jgi:hypothetical protein
VHWLLVFQLIGVILGVGHNAKTHAIGYFPWVVADVLLVLEKYIRWFTYAFQLL